MVRIYIILNNSNNNNNKTLLNIVARNVAVKRLNERRQARPRRFLVRPGRTNAWWSGFVNQIVVSEE